MIKIFIRPLQERDAYVSYVWRNNPEVWRLTGSSPTRPITLEMEKEWIESVLSKNNQKRFAICIEGSDQYIGNIQLTGVNDGSAELHLFIGEPKYWGKGIGKIATHHILEFAFSQMHLNEVYLSVNKKHFRAIQLYLGCGFIIREEQSDVYVMSCNKNKR